MTHRDQAIVQALRSDLALQIARHVEREGQTQAATAKRLGIPQPTMSKIMRGQVEKVSLELMLKIVMRAGLAVVLQTGKDPAEAGVYVSGITTSKPARIKSRLAEEAHHAARESIRSLTPEKRLEAHLKHSELVTALHRAGMEYRKTPGRSIT
ncbi:MAG: helix-turn-helix domain-containing protein [Steroidobacteraceae bacterium]